MTKIEDDTEIQYRQINPVWFDGGSPSRLAFAPTKKDEGKLSLDRSSSTSAKSSFDDFCALGLKSSGVFGITPEEFLGMPNPVACFESPLSHNPHHSHAEFSSFSNSQKKTKSQELRRMAISRGILHSAS